MHDECKCENYSCFYQSIQKSIVINIIDPFLQAFIEYGIPESPEFVVALMQKVMSI